MKQKWTIWLWSLLLLALTACNTPATTLSQTEEAAIYTAVIRQVYTVDDTFGGTFQAPTLYIIRTLDDSVGDPETAQSRETNVLTEETTTAVTHSLSDLPTDIIWVDSFADVPLDDQDGRVRGEGAAITLGNIHTQNDGTLQVPASIYVANLGAGGQTYVLEQIDNIWTITGTTGVQWIS